MLLDDLKARLGADQIQTTPEALTRCTLDTWPLRLAQRHAGAQPQPPICVITPRTTADVAAALRCLSAHGVPAVPRGGGSGVQGGAEPGPGAAVIDLTAMNSIIGLDETNQTVTVQAGLFLGQLEAWLNERGYIGGHYPQSIDLAQIGGLVATRSAGQFSTKYGNIEDLVVGLEAVLPGGEIIRIKNIPRRAAGPDLRHIFIGSEGALGIITEVTLKIFPAPKDRWLQAYAIPSMRDGLTAIGRIMAAGWRPAVVRLHDPIDVARHYAEHAEAGESILLLLSEGPEGYAQLEGNALNTIVTAEGGRPLGPSPVEAWLGHRNDVSDFEKYIRMGFIVDTIEVAAGWDRIADIYEETMARLTSEVPELLIMTGHSSHSYPQGTNLYFIIAAQAPETPDEVERVYRAIWSRAMDVTLAHGGTICHHHGIGKLRAPWLARELGSGYALLERIKLALDPTGMMNPGTLLPLGWRDHDGDGDPSV